MYLLSLTLILKVLILNSATLKTFKILIGRDTRVERKMLGGMCNFSLEIYFRKKNKRILL